MSTQRPLFRLGRWIGWLAFAPGGWIVVALLLAALFGLAHVLGWRVYTGVFSGTLPAPTPRASSEDLAMLGLVYATLYFITVLIAPVLILAAIVRLLADRLPGQPAK